ncbi:hypothetical protein GRX03_06880 [Halovenus sp. WSH3]|uniref:Uncharacterized protein n=1 Tax=Halovenus carboxidivorans TaxID=2692199 RepID=A0A6B0TDR2_9EURY|nr:DUF5809 family protein [Halovenus carboxidivorans]MXR51329.1 hypothetical protein [Halovenus carboxidivorans]
METEGSFLPETAAAARARYGRLESTAKGIVREVTRAMEFDGDEYDRRVTDDVIETAQDALFASQLEVTVGSREEYEQWRAETDHEVVEVGSENVDHVAWHAPPATGTAVAATFQDKREAAVETLRRQAFGRCYRELLAEETEQ